MFVDVAGSFFLLAAVAFNLIYTPFHLASELHQFLDTGARFEHEAPQAPAHDEAPHSEESHETGGTPTVRLKIKIAAFEAVLHAAILILDPPETQELLIPKSPRVLQSLLLASPKRARSPPGS